MAYIRVNDRIINNFKSDNLEAMLNSIIDTELSKDVSQVNTELINECIDALIGLEQEKDDNFNALIPLIPPDKFLNKIKPNGFSWKNANVFVRAGVVAAVVAGSTFTVNAAVESVTGVNLIQSATESVQNRLEKWGIIKTAGIDVVEGEDDDDDDYYIEETTTVPTTTEPTTIGQPAEDITEPEVSSTTSQISPATTKSRPNIDNVDGEDDVDETTTSTTKPMQTTEKTVMETTTAKSPESVTEKPVINPVPQEKVEFIGLSAEFDNFKTDYIYGEELSYDGLVLKAVYSNGIYEIVNLKDCSYTKKVDMTVTADYTLRIVYEGSLLKINITVRPDEETRGSKICDNDLYDYLLTERGAYITQYYGNEENIVLSQIDGNDVYAICSGVFEGKNIRFFNADNVEKIFSMAFKDCTELIDCYTPRAIYVGDSAFENCTELREAVFSSMLTHLGNSAYKNTGIKELSIPSEVTEIPQSLCEDCTLLESVIMKGRVMKIEKFAFSNCTALTKLEGTADVTEVGEYAFADDTLVNCDKPFDKLEVAGKYAFSKCNSLDIGDLPDIKEFDIGSFEYCYLLKSVTIPESMTKIPKSAFAGTRLTALNLHDNITDIGDYAFMSTMLTEVKIPVNVKKIGTHAFYTTRLRRVYFYNPEVEIDDDAFFAGTRLTFYAYENSTAVKYAEEYGINYELI